MTTLTRRRTSILCRREGHLLMIELEDPATKKRFWSLPGGMIEPEESAADCAVRETREETGYSVKLLSSGHKTNYLFRWNKAVYDCECDWFLAELAKDHDPEPVTDADYLLRALWIPERHVAMLLSYHPHLQQESLKLLQSDGIHSV